MFEMVFFLFFASGSRPHWGLHYPKKTCHKTVALPILRPHLCYNQSSPKTRRSLSFSQTGQHHPFTNFPIKSTRYFCVFATQVRRLSSRRYQNQPKLTPCAYCDKSDGSDLKQLFVHLATTHPKKYFACVPCEERFSSLAVLNEHNSEHHPPVEEKITRSKQKQAATTAAVVTVIPDITIGPEVKSVSGVKKTVSAGRELKNKKLAVKSTKLGVKRSARLQGKTGDGGQKVVRKPKSAVRAEEGLTKSSTSINPYPQFDSFFQVRYTTKSPRVQLIYAINCF